MSMIILEVNEVQRTLKESGAGAFVVHDKEVDIVRFAINSGFADIVLDGQVALRVMYQRPGETEVRAQTLTYYDTDGLHNYYDWQLSQSDLAKNGLLMVALCILNISGGEVSEWHTTPCEVRVLPTIHTDDSDEADESITPTVAQRVAVLETMIQRVASGSPIVVASTSAMTDTDQIYVLSTDGTWYYHNGSAWVAGGTYGAVATDTTLTQSGMPADAKKTGDEITDLSESVGDLKSAFDSLESDVAESVDHVDNAVNNFGLTTEMKNALLACFEQLAWITDDAQDYYDALYSAFNDNVWSIDLTLVNCISTNALTEILKGASYYAVIVPTFGHTLDGATVSIIMDGVDITSAVYNNGKINIPAVMGALSVDISAENLEVQDLTAVFTQGTEVIYTSDPLSYLKHFLVVTATYVTGDVQVLDDAYTISGTLATGTSTITVSYGGKTASFIVTVTAGLPSGYTSARWIASDGNNYISTAIQNQSGLSARYKFRKTATYGREVDGNILAGGNWTWPYLRSKSNTTNHNLLVFNRYGHNNSGVTFNWTLNTDYEIEAFMGNDDILVNGNTVVSNWAEGSPETPVETTLDMFANATATNIEFRLRGRIYYLEVYKNSVLINKFMPCVKDSNGDVGMYDTVGNAFYGSATSTPFVAGWYDE